MTNRRADISIGTRNIPDNCVHCRILEKWDVPHIGKHIEFEEIFRVNVNVGVEFSSRFGFAFSFGS